MERAGTLGELKAVVPELSVKDEMRAKSDLQTERRESCSPALLAMTNSRPAAHQCNSRPAN